ncbi:NAD(P)H-hydrate dehydratase [Rhodobacter sp. SGA-6-6]|uniref:NAD(P)H-hydrate dehydratase n=1 Tax=Rhodobacter sp. SGA-6-6 TaxID=2710882 RepID=UPI0013EDA6F8|nr:NAD(P)H-hydrate dehydratase [Rhodobacter sp. SGA-6-6]NGM46850.1 NAD(P)H-hydrate dehydratase [Rhodobacter sp. SGA-6-6]
MTELLTAAQMRAIEQAAIESGEVTGLELMERAGRGVVEAILAEWPELAEAAGALPRTPEYLGQEEGRRRAVVLCGPGNNGGDGFVVARLLRERGWQVEGFLYGDPGKLPPDARANYERWCGMGEVRALETPPDFAGVDLLVDALFGTGLTRALAPECANIATALISAVRATLRVCSVDIPSGICSDSGSPLETDKPTLPFIYADLTVTFQSLKLGHLLCMGPVASRKVVICDIGIGRWLSAFWTREGLSPVVARLAGASRSELSKRSDSHKYTHGHALILSGPSGHGGAARLSARGALRIGAGLVTVGCPPDTLPENAARLDAVMLRPVQDADALARMLEDRRINALCLGPGLGTGEREAGLVAAALGLDPVPGLTRDLDQPQALGGSGGPGSSPGRGLVLDADALTILSQTPDLFAALHDRCVLTPHDGEFARLFPDIAGKLAAPATTGPAYSKVDACREAAARAGCVVLFKGPDTVIADPSGRCAINSAHYDRAAPWLATAGSGDVLAGFIAGLLARGFPPFDAACTGAWLHVECARGFGPGLIAEDLPEELPKVFQALGL